MILFLIAWILLLPITIINFIVVKNKRGYFRSTALNIDIFANREFRTLWNKTLKKDIGYNFGKEGETISSALGKNIHNNSLSTAGKILVFILTEKHCLEAITT